MLKKDQKLKKNMNNYKNLKQNICTAFIVLILCSTVYPYSTWGWILDSPQLNRFPLILKRREAKQLETLQHLDKALKCGCFDTIKKFLDTLGKKWGHAK